MTYTQFVTDLATWTEISATDPDFVEALPLIIEMAEKRCYRDLDLVDASVTDTTGTLAYASGHTFVFPVPAVGPFISVDQLGVIISSVLYPMTPTSTAFIDGLYPLGSVSGIPLYFARLDDATALIAPTLGAVYGTCNVQTRGTVRLTPLSVSNPNTFLTLYLYDLFFSAAMVAASAYMRNFGAQADNPQMALSWKQEYDTRLIGAKMEESRKKFLYIGTERD